MSCVREGVVGIRPTRGVTRFFVRFGRRLQSRCAEVFCAFRHFGCYFFRRSSEVWGLRKKGLWIVGDFLMDEATWREMDDYQEGGDGRRHVC